MIALDLFAGTGWGVACQRLGILEHGVEIMPEAVASRTAAGMHTAYHDVWDGLANPVIIPEHDLLIASPPCQTFSVEGKGAGRKALIDVLALIATGAWQHGDTSLRDAASAAGLDDRTALVLSPLAYVAHSLPTHVVLEQVPTVLPVWEAVAVQLRSLGYSAVTGVLNAEQYGVPQTRRRAILIARRDGIAASMPTPTHSKYYSHAPRKLDPGVRKWVSMAEALGWFEDGHMRSNYGTGGDAAKRGERPLSTPAATITSKVTRSRWVHARPAPTIVGTRRSSGGILVGRQLDDGSRQDVGGHQTSVGISKSQLPGVRVSLEEASRLQSYPRDFPFQGSREKQGLQIGNAVPPLLGEAVIAAAVEGAQSEREALAA